MPWGIIASVAGPILGGLLGGDASEEAAQTQATAATAAGELQYKASQEATKQQREMFDLTRGDLEPWRKQGGVALDKIMSMLDSPQFTTPYQAPASPAFAGSRAEIEQKIKGYFPSWTPDPGEGILESFMRSAPKLLQSQPEGWGYGPEQLAFLRQMVPTADKSLDADALKKDFTAEDLAKDPIYAASRDFQLDEARRSLTTAASARGESDSGVLMKDLMKYGTGILSGLGSDAFNRFQADKGMDFNRINADRTFDVNRYNADRTFGYNQYSADKSQAFNMLAPIANLGQATGVQLGQIGNQSAATIGNTMMSGANAQAQGIYGAGNATAAGQVGQANAITGGISQGMQAYQNQQLLNRFLPQGTPIIPQNNAAVGGASGYAGNYGFSPLVDMG